MFNRTARLIAKQRPKMIFTVITNFTTFDQDKPKNSRTENETTSLPDSYVHDIDNNTDPLSINSSQASNWSAEENSGPSLKNINQALSLLSSGKLSPFKHQIRTDIDSLHPSSKRALKRKATSSVETLLECIAPGQGHQLFNSICSTRVETESSNLQDTVIKLYENSKDCSMKRQLLSMLARDHTKKELQEMIPGLTVYSIDQARLHASLFGEGAAPVGQMNTHHRQRMDKGKMVHALEFLFNPLFHQVSSYGKKEMKLDTGEKIEIPEVVRTICHANLIRMYQAFCRETDFAPLCRSSLFEILRVCPASKRTSLKGVDNIAADGALAFDSLTSVIQQLKQYSIESNLIDKLEKIKMDLQACKLYLKTDFKLHLAIEDQCPDHCVKFALSDPNDVNLRGICDHQHDMKCESCDMLPSSIIKLKQICTELKDLQDEHRSELVRDIEVSESSIQSWRQHIIRCFNQDRGRTSLLENLNFGEVLVIMDFAMKFLPLSFREKQSEWFGQKGINWHVCVCIFKDKDENLKHKTYVHLFDFVKQDWFAVFAILEHTLTTFRTQVPETKTAFIRSDNAGCYHCGSLWSSLHLISEHTGVCIKRYDFSESQDGKSYCDAKIAHLRSKILQYVCAGNDVKSASEMKLAIDSVGGVTGCQAAYVEIDQKLAEETSKRKTSSWKGISKISNIEIRENEVISWKAFQIGNGNNHTEEDLRKISPAPPPCALIILDEFIIPTSEEGNIHSHKEQESSDVVQCEELSSEALFEPQFNINSDTFSCVEEGCVKVFQSYAKLEAHILCGNHRYSNRIVSSMDQVKMNWKESCMSIVEHSIVSKSQQLQQGETSTEMGWALKKDRKSVRFNEKVKDYLRGIFSAGDNSGNKANPFDVSRNMRVCRDETGKKMFSPDQYLQPSQIASFFSRLSMQSRNPKPSKIDDEDLGSAIQLLEAIEAMDMMDTAEQN